MESSLLPKGRERGAFRGGGAIGPQFESVRGYRMMRAKVAYGHGSESVRGYRMMRAKVAYGHGSESVRGYMGVSGSRIGVLPEYDNADVVEIAGCEGGELVGARGQHDLVLALLLHEFLQLLKVRL